MTRSEMIIYIVNHPYEKVRHRLLGNGKYLYSNIAGSIFDETDHIFEDWFTKSNNGLRLRSNDNWIDGWYILDEKEGEHEVA